MKPLSGATAMLSAALLAASCASSVTPVKVAADDRCFRCGRNIAEPRLAAEMVDGPLASKFRTSGCLAKYLADHPSETGTTFVTDYATGTFVPPAHALFVPVIIDPHTNESDYRAYVSLGDAQAAARELNTTPVDWTTVLAKEKT
jgi:hypothetical protein